MTGGKRKRRTINISTLHKASSCCAIVSSPYLSSYLRALSNAEIISGFLVAVVFISIAQSRKNVHIFFYV